MTEYYYKRKKLPIDFPRPHPYEDDKRYPRASKEVNIVIDAVPFGERTYIGYIEMDNIPVYSTTGPNRVTILAKIESWLNSVYTLESKDVM